MAPKAVSSLCRDHYFVVKIQSCQRFEHFSYLNSFCLSVFRVLIFYLNETFYSPYEKRLMLHRSSAEICY